MKGTTGVLLEKNNRFEKKIQNGRYYYLMSSGFTSNESGDDAKQSIQSSSKE